MGIFCEHCETSVRGGLTRFQTHLKNFKHHPPFYCSEGACDKHYYAVKSSFIRHLLDSHSETCLSEDEDETSSSQTTESSQGSASQSGGSASQSGGSASQSGGSASQSGGSAPSRHSSQSHEEAQSNVSAHVSGSESGEETRDRQSSQLSRDSASGEESSDTEENGSDNELQNSAARMVLNLRRTGNVTETAMKKFIEETQKIMEQTVTSTRQQVVDNLKSAGVNEDVIRKSVDVSVTQPFKKLKTCKQQMKYFEENFNLVQPEPKRIGDRYDERVDKKTGKSLPVQVAVNFQYISVKKTLTAVLNNKVLFDLIHSESPSTDGKMRSFLDGSLAREHPLLKQHPHTLRLVLYIDDFECANPIGSKAGPHKITAVYLLIQNLPPEENARLRSIHLLAYAYRDDLPLDDLVDVLLEPFFDELKSLETEAGVTIQVDKKDFTLRATLIALAADTLGAHEVLGLFSSSAGHFCSHCMISRPELHQDIMAIGEMRSKETHLEHLREIETNDPLFVQQEYGVKRYSLLVHESKFTPFPDIFVKDGMHDILKGIAPMELKLSLREYCAKKKHFSVDFLNNALLSFNYGPDAKNKPSANISYESLTTNFSYTLRQSAAQTWCFLRVFPFLVGSKVPHDDPHLKLIVLLKRISEIIFSTAVSEDDLQNLSQLIKEHHNLFSVLYPPPERITEDHEEIDVGLDENFLLEEEEERETEQEAPQGTSSASKPAEKKKKKIKIIRPINKHHHLLHYCDSMRKTGPAVLYWCMRFEAKHAIAKRYAGICCNFKNLPVTMSKIHQINHTADLLDVVAVKDQMSSSKKSIRVAGETAHFEALHAKGLHATDVLHKVEEVTVGGYSYSPGLYVVLPMSFSGLPLFGLIRCIYLHNDNAFLITEDCQVSEYNSTVGAYCIQNEEYEHTVRAFSSSTLLHKPLIAWKFGNAEFLSPRCSLVDTIFDADDEA
ncbi:hypothetical protein FOCC_FOCC015392 [Frankliniella occidentalis]|nr:hypothetical protein FOCC_FOCC015392 [Frankliniella occidentalis]